MKKLFILLLVVMLGASSAFPGGSIFAQSGAIDRERLYTPFFDQNTGLDPCDFYDGESGSVADGTLESFISEYGQYAFDVGKDYGIPYEAIIAQAAHESAWGASGLTRNANNFFGIKAGSNWDGPTYVAQTWEVIDGQRIEVMETWRAYPSAYGSFTDYAELIHRLSNYRAALDHPSDPIQYIQAVYDGGYATDPDYVEKVRRTITSVTNYISENDLFPPSSEVAHNTDIPRSTAPGGYCDNTASGPHARRIIEIAEQELAKNPQQWDQNVMNYTLNRREPWCADFLSWVFNEAGVPFSGGWAADWQIPAVINMQAWFQNGTNGSQYFHVNEALPQPGDVAFYRGDQTPDRNSTSHVNIVISVNEAEGTMVTIGGNESNTVRKSTRQIQLGAQSLVGFGRMNP